MALYDRGEVEQATQILLHEVPKLYDRLYELCARFIAANEEYVDAATRLADRQIRWTTLIVAICVALTIGTGAGLAWLFFHGVLAPLRSMTAEVRQFAGQTDPAAPEVPEDELRVLGRYLHMLMTDVAQARSSLDQSRDRLANAEKLASVGKIAAGIAHEIRNPLTSIRMCLFSIRKAVRDRPELRRKFEIVTEEIMRLESIVRNFLEFARPPTPKLARHDVSVLIDKTLELVGHRLSARNIRVERAGEPNLPAVVADADQIKQVFINLLNNAVEAMPGGGEVRITTARARSPDGRLMAVVRVQDGGPGMPDDVRERIFEPFFTTKDDGTGLGLSIAARVMAQHAGRLVLESSTSQGTTFAVWIPLAASES